MGYNSHANWGTEEEIKFVAGCGTGKWSSASSMRSTPRRTILLNLKESYAQRTDWTGIDQARVLDFLDTQIRAEK